MSTNRLTFAVFGNTFQAKKSSSIRKVAECLRGIGAEIIVDRPFLNFLCSHGVDLADVRAFEGAAFEADFAVSMGGDGTFLKTAARVSPKGIPIIGVNTGRLGFLAEVLLQDAEQAFKAVAEKRYTIERHVALTAESEPKHIQGGEFALNDIAVLKRDAAAMITIHAYVNGEYLVSYQADGLIVSTSTGSTAYSLSNGGPIIVPGTDTITLTPVAPHSLSMRPIVMRSNSIVTLSVEARSHNFLLAVDGRSETLPQGTTVTVRRAPYTTDIVRCCGRGYFDALREKMGWGNDAR